MTPKAMFRGTLAGILVFAFGAGVAAIAALPTTVTNYEIKGVMLELGDRTPNHIVITQNPDTGKLDYKNLGNVPVFADVPADRPMYATDCSGTCAGLVEIHVHSAANLAGGSWKESDFMHMNERAHRLVRLD